MNRYKIFRHPSGATEAVKQGWSWPAFFFGFAWALAKRMWDVGIGVLFVFLVIGFMVGASQTREAGDTTINLLGLIANILFGVYGNPLREKNLGYRGFEPKKTVSAASPKEAVALFSKGDASA